MGRKRWLVSHYGEPRTTATDSVGQDRGDLYTLPGLLPALPMPLARGQRALHQARRAQRSHNACRAADCKALGSAPGGSIYPTYFSHSCMHMQMPCRSSSREDTLLWLFESELEAHKTRDKGAVTPAVLILLHPTC